MTNLTGTSKGTWENCASVGYKIRVGVFSLEICGSEWCKGGTRGACELYKYGEDQVLLIFRQRNSEIGAGCMKTSGLTT